MIKFFLPIIIFWPKIYADKKNSSSPSHLLKISRPFLLLTNYFFLPISFLILLPPFLTNFVWPISYLQSCIGLYFWPYMHYMVILGPTKEFSKAGRCNGIFFFRFCVHKVQKFIYCSVRSPNVLKAWWWSDSWRWLVMISLFRPGLANAWGGGTWLGQTPAVLGGYCVPSFNSWHLKVGWSQ